MAPEYALHSAIGGPLAGHPWRRYAVLGDSVVQQPGGFAELVRDELDAAGSGSIGAGPGVASLNLGRRNLRAAEVRATQLSPALAFAPDLALVVCGANDAMRPGYEARADAVDAEVAGIIRPLQEAGARVITVSVFVMREYPRLPAWLGPGFARRMALLARRTNALAAALGTIHVDLSDHPAIGAGEALTGEDGLHGNAHSHRIAAAAVIQRLTAEL
ncbi:GDSL-type esterase/lipase family protein [Dactylosporangium sp. NPDC000555]|uniref:GDSL-type esterase/lipase family protein n=1 Tax=Dactylosporangium sp. NPDC000555 TaxID=3154260 RepID=UPI00332AD1C4